MGADGGIKISKIKDIKENWPKIKADLVMVFERYANRADDWEAKYAIEAWNNCTELPKDISKLDGKEIVKMLGFLASCDCPYLYEDSIITAEGDNVTRDMQNLSMCLPGISIETWT